MYRQVAKFSHQAEADIARHEAEPLAESPQATWEKLWEMDIPWCFQFPYIFRCPPSSQLPIISGTKLVEV